MEELKDILKNCSCELRTPKDKIIKMCPFCGGEPKVEKGQDMYEVKIVCSNCGCGTPIFDEYFNVRDYAAEQMRLGKVDSVCGIILNASIEKANQAWNRRCCE